MAKPRAEERLASARRISSSVPSGSVRSDAGHRLGRLAFEQACKPRILRGIMAQRTADHRRPACSFQVRSL
jgi:ribosomal protein L34E